MRTPQRTPLVPAEWEERVNYYHFGDVLADLAGLSRQFTGRQSVGQRVVQAYLKQQRLPTSRLNPLLDVLSFFTGPRGQRISLRRLDRALEHGHHWRQHFQALGCRGFSFGVSSAPHFRGSYFKPAIKLKVALLTDPDLYYPPQVRQALRQLPANKQHVLGSIGWMLGQEERVGDQIWWYIINVQSDLTSRGVSCLREIFRGWQRVLFWSVLGLARRRGVAMIALPPVQAVACGSNQGAPPDGRLDAWRPLYDGVASFFGMRHGHSTHPINVQAMQFLPEKWCSTFFVGEVDQLWRCYRDPSREQAAGTA